MTANVNWNTKNTSSGILPDRVSGVIPLKKDLFNPPTKAWIFHSPATIPVVSKARL